MMKRRQFIKSASLAALEASVLTSPAVASQKQPAADRRVAPGMRKFKSEAVEDAITKTKREIADPELAALFENCFPNTLDTTIRYEEHASAADTFVITGDIPAMWLRDSSAQVWPYLPFAAQDGKLKKMLRGVIRRQARCILIDPYANAFNYAATGSEWSKDVTDMKPELHERKWEIDSLCYPVRLAHGYWKSTGDISCFDAPWQSAMKAVLKTFREQQRLHGPGLYKFERNTTRATDTLPGDGYGNPTRPCGLIHSAFRPSDDACIFPFLIPANLFAIVSLKQMAEIFEVVFADQSFASESRELAEQVEQAVQKQGVAQHLQYGKVYAYEVDGFGNQLFMDDANVPSLLSLPYLGCCSVTDPFYQNTRRLILSHDNPYFFKGKAAEGIGGPHVGLGMVWPLGIIMRALTAGEDNEIRFCLEMLKSSHANTGFMHESFSVENPGKFTRPWFAWANTLFGELILNIHAERPHLLK
jgi:uncharacterized protein